MQVYFDDSNGRIFFCLPRPDSKGGFSSRLCTVHVVSPALPFSDLKIGTTTQSGRCTVSLPFPCFFLRLLCLSFMAPSSSSTGAVSIWTTRFLFGILATDSIFPSEHLQFHPLQSLVFKPLLPPSLPLFPVFPANCSLLISFHCRCLLRLSFCFFCTDNSRST